MLRGERKVVGADSNKSVGEHTVAEHKNVSWSFSSLVETLLAFMKH